MCDPNADLITLPAPWASALVNGDTSSFDNDPKELAAYETQLAGLRSTGWEVVDVERDENGEALEPRFTNCYALYGGTAGAGDVLSYVIRRVR
jgi:hypothetical protein